MATIEETLDHHFMKRFLAKPFDAGDRIYKDPMITGLDLRVQGKRASWVYRYKGTTVTLGYAAVPDPKNERMYQPSASWAVELSKHIRYMLSTGHDKPATTLFLQHFYGAAANPNKKGEGDVRAAEAMTNEDLARARGERRHETAWTFRTAVENYIEAKLDKNHKKPIAEPYAKQLRSYLDRKEFAQIADEPVTRLNAEMGEDIRLAVYKNSGVSSSKKAVLLITSVLKYTYSKNPGKSGLARSDQWWLALSTDTVINPREREPSVADLGKTLALAEYFLDHRLPGRVGVQHGVRDNVFAAFVWIAMSGQRQGSGLDLLKANLVSFPGKEEEGWMLAHWDGGQMKNGRRFLLPIPPKMATCITALTAKGKNSEDSEWAFPSEDGEGKHVDRSATLGVLRRLAGLDVLANSVSKSKSTKKEKKDKVIPREKVDLLGLNGIDYYSPHDIRNTVTMAMDGAGMPGGASAILAHSLDIGKDRPRDLTKRQFDDWLRNRIATVTRENYGKNVQHLNLKCEAMLAWTDPLFAAWEDARSKPLFVHNNQTVILNDLKTHA